MTERATPARPEIARNSGKKMERVTGVDKARSDEEPEQSEGNRCICEQSDFLQKCKKAKCKKKKQQRGKLYFTKLLLAFC